MNTPTPAQALGEVMALSELGTPSPWRWEYNQRSKNVEIAGGKPTFDKTVMDFARWGMSSAQPRFMATQDCFRIMHKLSDRPDWIAPIEGREHHADWCADVVHPDAALMVAAVNFIRQHGQHFAGLVEENDRLHAEFDFLTAQHEQCTAYMVNHRGRLVYANSGMRDAYSDEHVRAEAAEARCAELEAEAERLRGSVSGWKLRCDQWQDQADSDRARVREAEGLLREAAPFVDTNPDLHRAGGDELQQRIAAFLAARG